MHATPTAPLASIDPQRALQPRHSRIPGPDGVLALRQWGRPGQPLILMLHGYPDHSGTWDAIAPLLADAFHVVAYDVRGAGDSFIPQRQTDYTLARLTADFRAVIDTVSPTQPVHLVAHDWGSLQGWEFVTAPRLAGRIASYTSCSGPCLDHVGHWLHERLARPTPRHLAQFARQSLKSWYIAFFHLPLLPQLMWRALLGPQWPRLMRWLERAPVPAHASQTRDGIHGIQLYRANMLPRLLRPRERVAHAPVHLIVPLHDRFVSPLLSADLSRWVSDLSRREVAAGHWITAQQPALFAGQVRGFVKRIERRRRQAKAAAHAA
jgi:pimeloyl-ACP methyl ester carboxylesterase